MATVITYWQIENKSSCLVQNTEHGTKDIELADTRGDQKVLQLPTLVNKMLKINCWVRISKY